MNYLPHKLSNDDLLKNKYLLIIIFLGDNTYVSVNKTSPYAKALIPIFRELIFSFVFDHFYCIPVIYN